MRFLGKFPVLLLALSLFASPVMACFSPDSSLTDEERDCCQQMAGNCSQMPSSHSCCQTTVRDGDPYLVNSRLVVSAPAQAAPAVLPALQTVQVPDAMVDMLLVQSHAPPGPPIAFLSPLRI